MKQFTTGNGRQAFELVEDNTVAIVLEGGEYLQINQKDPLEDSDFKYDRVILSKEVIIALAEQLKGEC